MATDLSPWLEAIPSSAGFHLVLLFKVEVDVALVIDLAKKVEVGLYGLDDFFYQQAPRNGLLMGFGAIETLDIDIALDRLREILLHVA